MHGWQATWGNEVSVQVLVTSGQSSLASASATTARTEILETSVSQTLEDSTPTQE